MRSVLGAALSRSRGSQVVGRLSLAGRARSPVGGCGGSAAMRASPSRTLPSRFTSWRRSPLVSGLKAPRSIARMPGRSRSAVARPSAVISTNVLRRSSGLGVRRPAATFEQVQGGGHGGRRDQDSFADLGGGERPSGAVEDRQHRAGVHGHVEMGGHETSEFLHARLAGSSEGGVCLGASGVPVGVLGIEVRLDLDHAACGGGRAPTFRGPASVGLRQL